MRKLKRGAKGRSVKGRPPFSIQWEAVLTAHWVGERMYIRLFSPRCEYRYGYTYNKEDPQETGSCGGGIDLSTFSFVVRT